MTLVFRFCVAGAIVICGGQAAGDRTGELATCGGAVEAGHRTFIRGKKIL